jgi:hypothetical protein
MDANELVYTYVALKPNNDIVKLTVYVYGTSFNSTPQRLSATFFAAGATTGSEEIAAYWKLLPPDVRNAILEYPPPKTETGVILPYGTFPATKGWNRAVPLQAVPDPTNVCAKTLGTLTAPDAGKEDIPLDGLLALITDTLDQTEICTSCSGSHVAMLFVWKLVLESSLVPRPPQGVGFVCDQLVNGFKWSDPSMSAALLNLKVPVLRQKYLSTYLETVFWFLQGTNNHDWSAQITAWLQTDGYFDDTATNGLCQPVTSLTSTNLIHSKPLKATIEKWSLRDTETPLPWGMRATTEKWANRHLYSPPKPGQGFLPIYWPSRHESPPPPDMGPLTCESAVAWLKNGNTKVPNMTMLYIQDALQPLMLDPCSGCDFQTSLELITYFQVFLSVPPSYSGSRPFSAGIFMQYVTTNYGWSMESCAAALNLLATPIENQNDLQTHLHLFFQDTVDGNGKDWATEIHQIMSTYPDTTQFPSDTFRTGC